MNDIYIRVEVIAGALLAEAAREMCETATRLGITCEAKMNGITVWARPHDDHEELARQIDKQLVSTAKFRFAGVPEKKVP